MIVQQLFDPASSTYTYVLLDVQTKQAVIIDPVDTQIEKYLQELVGYTLKLIIDTHIHADHITGAYLLKQKTGARYGLNVHAEGVDVVFSDGMVLSIGDIQLQIIATPGHTAESVCIVVDTFVFTGDTLLIGKCGRTDFQNGDAGALYDSVTKKLFTLSSNIIVYPGHDYEGRTQSTIGDEQKHNLRLANKSKEEFMQIMNTLNLPKPKMMDIAVPANMRCGKL